MCPVFALQSPECSVFAPLPVFAVFALQLPVFAVFALHLLVFAVFVLQSPVFVVFKYLQPVKKSLCVGCCYEALQHLGKYLVPKNL